jgi:hypothetical protein
MANVRSKSRTMGNLSSVRSALCCRYPTPQLASSKLLLLVICEQPQLSDYQEGLRKQQLVFEFDIQTWEVSLPSKFLNASSLILNVRYEQEAIKIFNITEPIIPQRPKVTSTNGKWYG